MAYRRKQQGVRGGLVTISASHYNVFQSFEFLAEGCGFLVDQFRLKGWTLAVINLYLQSGCSLQAEPNCTIVATLLATVVWEGSQQISEITSVFASWSRDAAASCGILDGFPGSSFVIQVKPLVAPSAPHRLWKGHAESFWDRIVAWSKHFRALQSKPLTHPEDFLAQADTHWADVGNMPLHQWKAQAFGMLNGCEPDDAWVAATSRQQRHARKLHLSDKSADYQSWLQSSMKAGMRPLFRALSNPEAKVERPFLDSPLEFRPFLRLEFWSKLWKAQPSPLPELDSKLQHVAREHAAQLPPLSLEQIKQRIRKLSNKAGGADGWSYAQFKVLPDEALALLHNFPPLCADTALKVYRGARYIISDSVVSPRCFGASGLMAGCPYAPAIAKLALFPSLSSLHKSKLADNITAWLDDVSVDTEGAQAEKTAHRAAQSYNLLKHALQRDGLHMSIAKTITVAKARQAKGQARAGRQRTLKVPSLSHKWRLYKGGIFASAAWGHQAQGISPKRLKWLRGCAAQQLQRHKLGSLDLLFDLHCKFEDPLITILTQHFATITKVFLRWPGTLWGQLKTSWSSTWSRLKASPHPWKCVSGPMAAAQAYLMQLEIDGQSLEHWTWDDEDFTCDWKEPGMPVLLPLWMTLSLLKVSIGPAIGPESDVKPKPNAPRSGYMLCGKEQCFITKMEALSNARYAIVMPRGRMCSLSADTGLGATAIHLSIGLSSSKSLWATTSKLSASTYVFSTDASGGPDSVDTRLRIVAFALLALQKEGDELTCVASITGFLPVGSSVAEGETHALQLLAENVDGFADVTCDCQTAIKNSQRLDNLDCHWVRSHQSAAAFEKEFGADQLWRMKANSLADDKCGKLAATLVDINFKNDVQELDRLAQQISTFLAERVELLLTSKKVEADTSRSIAESFKAKEQEVSVVVQPGDTSKQTRLSFR
ncbi:unnamed protein product [Symbiodinium sp. CCMP2592]|nr:unnamed protein product [Symbiodinium sp. CCMP2592]